MDVKLQMKKACYDVIIKEMQPLLDGQKFVAVEDYFKNEKTAVKVSYDEDRRLFVLSVAQVTDNEVGEFSSIGQWLFEDDQTEKDAIAVGVDFADTLRGNLGIKAEKTAVNVALPVAEKGEEINILALTQRLLATFPQFKEDYKQDVAKNGKFLYMNFFMTRFVPEIKNMLSCAATNKKPLKKLFDMLDEMYVSGDSVTTDAVVAIISAVIYQNEDYKKVVFGYIEEDKHLQTSINEFGSVLKSNKKLQKALIK